MTNTTVKIKHRYDITDMVSLLPDFSLRLSLFSMTKEMLENTNKATAPPTKTFVQVFARYAIHIIYRTNLPH